MKIIKRRINNVENHLSTIKDGEEFHIAFTDYNNQINRISAIGFTPDAKTGEQILPAVVGSISRFNANGKFKVRRDLPKEEYYIERYWKKRDWRGNITEEVFYVRRERYQRELIAPPSEELLLDSYKDENIIVSRSFIKSPENFAAIKHTINLFLELFRECDLIRENYHPFLFENIIKLNWKIFPTGEYPWTRVKDIAQERIERQPAGTRPVIAKRLEAITAHHTDFVAIGRGGFSDYIVFGFSTKGIFILESLKNGNATYVFGDNWAQLSKMTKAEILINQLEIERIFHRPGWEIRINELL